MTNSLNCFTKSPYKWYRFRDNWIHYTSCIKFAWQRATRGYSDKDTWSLSAWHTDVLRAALTHFRDNLHGHPAHLDDGGDEVLGQRMWEEYLYKIIALLDKCDEELFDEREQTLINDYNIGHNPTEEEKRLFCEELDELWEERCNNIKEALRLLGEEYWDLWD